MTISQFFAIVEIRTKIVSISTFFLALLYALGEYGTVPWYLALLTFAAALAVDMGTTAFNTFFDFLNAVDHKQENQETAKVLVHENVPPEKAFIAAAGCYAAAVILGGIIAWLAGWEVAAAGAVCMAVGFFYTGGPYPISRTPLGELFAGGFLGSVFFLITVYILSGDISLKGFLVSLPPSMMIAAILAANNACDIEGDKRAGRRTLAILLGSKRAPWVMTLYISLGLLLAAGLGQRGILPLPGVIPLGLSLFIIIPTLRGMYSRGFSHETKGPSMGSISKIFITFSFAYAAALIIGIAAPLFS